MADDVKENYDAKFLEGIDFAFKKYHLIFVAIRRKNCKLFMQSLPLMMFLLKQQELIKLAV